MPVSFTGSGTNSGNLLYFYHPDHLGSSSLVTNADGAVTQHVEYVPFGEVFIEERNSTWNTPYLFNAKELDEETGLYYYGARYYDPKTSVWISVDPLAEDFTGVGSYVYCYNNPVEYIDPDGRSPKGKAIKRLVKKIIKAFGDDGVKQAAKTTKGDFKPVSRVHAEKLLKENKSVYSTNKRSNKSAKRLMEDAAGDSKVKRHDGHNLKDAQGNDTGETGFDHYQKKSGDGSHVLYDTKNQTILLTPAANETESKAGDKFTSFGLSIINKVENIGVKIFGNNEFGNFIDELNPLNLGMWELLNDLNKRKETPTPNNDSITNENESKK